LQLMLTAISTAYGKLISNYTTVLSTIQQFESSRSIFLEAHFIGAFRRGNKPPVLPGEDKKL